MSGTMETGGLTEAGATRCPEAGGAAWVGASSDSLSPAFLGDAPVPADAPLAYVADAPGPVADPPARRKSRGTAKLAVALLAAILAFESQGVGMVLAYEFGFDVDLGAAAFGAVCACLLLALVGGARMLVPRIRGLRDTWSLCWWPIVIGGFTAAVGVLEVVRGHAELVVDWPLRTLGLAALCLSIGVFEECVFRGLIHGGLLARLGRTRAGVYAAALMSSLIFGAMHIEWWALDYGQPIQVVQAVLKIMQAGMLGFVFAVCATRARGVAGVALAHALLDFLLLFASVALSGGVLTTEYVSVEETQAVGSIVSYVVACVLYIPPTIAAWMSLGQVELPVCDYLAARLGKRRAVERA